MFNFLFDEIKKNNILQYKTNVNYIIIMQKYYFLMQLFVEKNKFRKIELIKRFEKFINIIIIRKHTLIK